MLVAVYGTLKKDFYNHPRIFSKGQYRCVSPGASFAGMMIRVVNNGDLAYPGLILRQDVPDNHPARHFMAQYTVHAEVYEIDEKIRQEMDILENHPEFYKRTPYKHERMGEVHIYALRPSRYLKGHQLVVPGGYWYGPSTSGLKVDFFEGDQKPKIHGWNNKLPWQTGHHNSHIYDTLWEEGDEDPTATKAPEIKELNPEILIDTEQLDMVQQA
jgi:gamma-glutamylcyclotransferase (GGCT)/AIG2-like uncharacterized protein YtfP